MKKFILILFHLCNSRITTSKEKGVISLRMPSKVPQKIYNNSTGTTIKVNSTHALKFNLKSSSAPCLTKDKCATKQHPLIVKTQHKLDRSLFIRWCPEPATHRSFKKNFQRVVTTLPVMELTTVQAEPRKEFLTAYDFKPDKSKRNCYVHNKRGYK
jgi:hypothetical protein